MELPPQAASERYCTLATQGVVSGRRHTAELWFHPADGGVWMMSGSGGLVTWCLNLTAQEQAVLRIGEQSWLVRAASLRDDDPERSEVLGLFHAKYDPPGKDRLPYWIRHARVLHLVLLREM